MARYVVEDLPAAAPGKRYVVEDQYSPAYGLFQSAVGQGLGLGFGDEVAAVIRSSLGPMTYEEALADERRHLDKFRARNRLLSSASEIAGGLATPGLGLLGGVLRPAATAAGRIGQSAGVGAATGAVQGFGTGEGAAERTQQAAVGGVLGSAIGTAVGGAGEAVRQVSRARANMGEAGAYGNIADNLPNGVNQLADEIAAGASRGNAAINRRTLDILGEEMVRANGNVPQAQQAAVQRIVAEAGVTPATARAQIGRLSGVHRDSQLMLAEYPAVSQSDTAQRMSRPGNVDLDALGRSQNSTTQAALDTVANNGNAPSAIAVRNAVSERQDALGPAMRETLESFAPRVGTGRGQRPATIADSADMEEAARFAGSLAYQVAHNAPMAITPQDLQTAVNAFVAHHAARANARSGDVGDAIIKGLREFFERDPMTGNVLRNTAGRPVVLDVTGPDGLQRLQDARSALGATIRKAARETDNNTMAALQPMYRDTRPNVRTGAVQPDVTRIMETASPQWAVANRTWADLNFQEMAQELGDAFVTRAGPRFREQMAQFRNMAPEAQNIVRIHFLQKLFDKLDNLGDTHSVSKLFANDHNRNMIRVLFGDEAAVAFTRGLRDQRVAESTQRMMGNSATHRRGQAQRQMDAETGLMTAVSHASGRGVRNWLMERAAQIMTENRNRPMADILTTPMRDTARVAQHLHRMRQQEGRLQQAEAPRNWPLPVAGMGGAAGATMADYLIGRQR